MIYPDNVPKNRMARTRYRLWLKQRYRCFCCEREIGYEIATLEHVIPKAKGGANREDNFVVTCHGCNAQRGTEDLRAFIRRVHRRRKKHSMWPTIYDHQKPELLEQRRKRRKRLAEMAHEYKRRKDEGFPLDQGVNAPVNFGETT